MNYKLFNRKNGKKALCLALTAAVTSFAFSETILDDSDYAEERLDSIFVSREAVEDTSDKYEANNLFSVGRTSAEPSKVEKLLSMLEDKTDEALASRSYGKSVASRIREIEDLKQELCDLLGSDDSAEYNENIRRQMEAEIAQRVNRAYRAAETNGDGSLNERGQQKLANDIEAIQKKYDEISNSRTPDSKTLKQAETLKNKIYEKTLSLDASEFTESSLQNSGVNLKAKSFTTVNGIEGWPFTVTYVVDGTEICGYSGVMTYADISGKQVPKVPSIHDADYETSRKKYENFLDSVEVFNEAFAEGLEFVEATLSGSVKVGNAPSSYVFTISNVALKNIVSEKTVNTYRKNTVSTYQSEPQISVDFDDYSKKSKSARRSEVSTEEDDYSRYEDISLYSEPKSETKKVRVPVVENPVENTEPVAVEKKEEKRQKKVVEKRNDFSASEIKPAQKVNYLQKNKTTLGSVLYFLPGTFNAYMDGDRVAFTTGYSLTAGVAKHFYIGMNAEVCLVPFEWDFNLYGNGCEENYIDWEDVVITGVVGWNWNIGPAVRMSAFLEAGLLFDNLAAGTGVGLEFAIPSSNVALQASFSNIVDDQLKSYFKASVGAEILF